MMQVRTGQSGSVTALTAGARGWMLPFVVLVACQGGEPEDLDDVVQAGKVQTCRIDGIRYNQGALNPANACESCQPSISGKRWTPVTNGSACDDGNACTLTDACSAGSCVGADEVACTALDACHLAGACDPSTGACSDPAVPNGTSCSIPNGSAVCRDGECTLSFCGNGYLHCAENTCCLCSDSFHWQLAVSPSGTPTVPVIAGGSVYVAQGTVLLAIDSRFGFTRWRWQSPTPAPLASAFVQAGYVYQPATDGFLYKIDVATGITAQVVDLRMLSMTTTAVTAVVGVQTYSGGSARFRQALDAAGHANDDLILVASSSSDLLRSDVNRVIALYASDLTRRWTFNATNQYRVQSIRPSCPVDPTRDAVFCGANADAISNSLTLFALDVVTGQPRWASADRSATTSPVLVSDQLYVGTGSELGDGKLSAFDPDGDGLGSAVALWNVNLQSIPRAIDASGPYIFVLDADNLYKFTTAGMWPPGFPLAFAGFSALEYVPESGMVYVGRADGTVVQVDAGVGYTNGGRQLLEGGGIELLHDIGYDGLPRLFAITSGLVSVLTLPLCPLYDPS